MQDNETLLHVRGDAFNVAFEVEDMDFTNLIVKSHFKKDINQASPDLTFLSSDGSINVNIISTTKTILTFNKTSTQMAAIIEGTYKYDIQVETSATDRQTICAGNLKVIKDVTV